MKRLSKMKIIIAGPRGRMGREAVKLVTNTEHFELMAVIDYKYEGKILSDLEGFSGILDVPIYTNIEKCLQNVKRRCIN